MSKNISAPRYRVLKETYFIFDRRAGNIKKDKGLMQNCDRFLYFRLMDKIRKRVYALLQTYSEFKAQDFHKKAPGGEISEKLAVKLDKLSLPPKHVVKGTLTEINRALGTIANDCHIQKFKEKKRRICELCRLRRNVCCLYSKYPRRSRDSSPVCYRFKPCSKKLTRIWEDWSTKERKPFNKKFRSRRLEFEFDEYTNNLAEPRFSNVMGSNFFFDRYISWICYKIHTTAPCEKEEIERLRKRLDVAVKKRCVLELMRKKIEEKMKQKPADGEQEDMKNENEKGEEKIHPPPGYFACGKAIKAFTHFLELPSRRRLIEVLNFYNNLQAKIIAQRALDVKKEKVDEENSSQESEKTNLNEERAEKKSKNDEEMEVPEMPPGCETIYRDAEKLIKGHQRKRVDCKIPKSPKLKTFQARIEDNIKFVESLLQNYPLPEFQHCKFIIPTKYRFRPIERKVVHVEAGGKRKIYNFDTQTNKIASPKIQLIREARIKYQKLLEKFQADVRNASVINSLVKSEGDENVTGNVDNVEMKSRLLMTSAEIAEQQKKQKFARATNEYRNLKEKRNRLWKAIAEQQRILDEFHAQKAESGPSDYFHHKICYAEQVVEPRKEYRMAKPHKSVSASTAPLKRMKAALEMYERWAKENKYHPAFKKHFRGVQDELQRRIELQSGQRKKDNLKYPSYETRLLVNKKHLEDDVNILMNAFVEDSHAASHRKLDDNNNAQIESSRVKGAFDYVRLQVIARPKIVLLKSTLDSFGLFMSDDKRKRIMCELCRRSARKPEDLENLVRTPTADKSKLPHRHVTRETNDRRVYEQMLKSLKINILDMLTKGKVKCPVSRAFQDLHSSIYDSIAAINGEPENVDCKKLYLNLANILSNFIMEAEMRQ